MHSTRLIHLLMAALSVTAVTGVAWLGDEHAGIKRQDSNDLLSLGPDASTDSPSDASADQSTNAADDSSTSTTPPASTSTQTSTQETSSTPTTSPSTTPPTSTNAPPTSTQETTSPPTTTPPTSTRPPQSSSTSGNGGDDTSSAPPDTTAPPTTSTFVTIITTTDSSGQTVISSSSSTVVSIPTSAADTQGNGNQTMDPNTKNTIIGVCVGVGGAIILAAAGVLYWRLRSKKRSQEENEELVSYGDGFAGPGSAEKTEPSGASAAGRSPFQSTLESYHAPSQTNAASNF